MNWIILVTIIASLGDNARIVQIGFEGSREECQEQASLIKRESIGWNVGAICVKVGK